MRAPLQDGLPARARMIITTGSVRKLPSSLQDNIDDDQHHRDAS
jgi:hypothetical protein